VSQPDARTARITVAAAALVGTLVAAATAVAMWSSGDPWTFTMDTGGVFLGQTLPAFRQWFAGEIPEWSDLLWGGFPLIGDCTTAALYPLHAVAYLTTLHAPLRFFDAAFALHLGVFAAGSAYLARPLGAGVPASALTGVLAALCPFAHYCAMAFFPVFGAQAWWPWAFAAAERLAQPGTPMLGRAMVLGWIALAAQVLVGVPEQATYCAVVTAAWLLTRGGSRDLGERVSRLLVLGAGAVALSAPQLFPTFAILPWSQRAGETATPELVSLYLTEPLRLLVAGRGAMNDLPSFLGLATLALALVAVVARRPRAAFLVIVAVVAIAIASGPEMGVYGWLHRLPPFGYFRNPVKIYALAEFSVVWAAGLGADVLWRRRSRRAVMAAAVLVTAALGERALFLAGEIPLLAKIRSADGLMPHRFAALAASAPARARDPQKPPLVIYDVGGPIGGDYARSIGALLGIASLRAGTVALLSPMHLDLLMRPLYAPRLDLFGVRYVVAPTSKCEMLFPRIAWKRIEQTPEFCVFQNAKLPEHHAILHRVTIVTSEPEMRDAVLRYRGEGVPVVAPPGATGPQESGVLELRAYAPGRASLVTTTTAPALVLVRDSWAPGWTVHVDDRPVTPYPAAGIYFAVPVGKGVHTIELAYRAPGFRPGLAVAASWMVAAAAIALGRWLGVRASSATTRAR